MPATPGPPLPGPGPDPGALAMHTMSDLNQVGTIATAQLLGGLSGLLVSEGLARVAREILGMTGSQPAPSGTENVRTAAPAEAGATEPPDREMLAGASAKAFGDLVAQGVVGRIIALNSLNTYLSLAASEQLRRVGAHLAAGGDLCSDAPPPHPAGPPPPQPPQHQPPAPAPYPSPHPAQPQALGPVFWSQPQGAPVWPMQHPPWWPM